MVPILLEYDESVDAAYLEFSAAEFHHMVNLDDRRAIDYGEHEGFARYTVGQRKGLPGGFAEPMYVVAIRPETREVVIGRGAELFGHDVSLEEVNWLADPLGPGDPVWVQCRYRARAVPGTVDAIADGRLALRLAQPVRAITPGQSGVLYDADDRLLGGGIIA